MHYATEICVSIRVSSINIISLDCLPDFYSLKWYCRLSLPKIPISGGILRGSRRERLLSKFVENECEKIDRLMELYMRWVCLFVSLFLWKHMKRENARSMEVNIIWRQAFLLNLWYIFNFSFYLYFRYSDRVKAETERMDQLELDDLEVSSFLGSKESADPWNYITLTEGGFYTLQMDEEEKYNRKLESGLYTLQVWFYFGWNIAIFSVLSMWVCYKVIQDWGGSCSLEKG